MEERRLNADIAGSIAQFQRVMRGFELKTKLYRRILKGRGLEFDGYRDYSPDDDANLIDWKASKRVNKLITKQYTQEKNLKIMFIVDVSERMVFGSEPKLKCEYATETIAALANLILNSRDKVGYILFSDGVKEFVGPQLGRKHFIRFMNTLTDARMYGGSSNLENAIDFSLKYLNKDIASIIIVSDFINLNEKINNKLSLLVNQFETMAIMIRDPLDRTLPNISGEVIIENPETREKILINPNLARASYEKFAMQQEVFVKNLLFKTGIDTIELTTDKSFISSLATFLKERTKGAKKRVAL